MQEYVQLPGNSLNNLYANGCVVSYNTSTSAIISTGQVRDSTNSFDIVVANNLSISLSFNGVNGLDTGTVANNAIYYVFVVFDPSQNNQPACVASLSATAPIMPSKNQFTYSLFRMVGVLFTNNVGAINQFSTEGNFTTRHIQWNTLVTVLNGGAATTFTTFNLVAGAPTSNLGKVTFISTYLPILSGNQTMVRAFGSTAAYMWLDTAVSNFVSPFVVQNQQFSIIPGILGGFPSLQYKVTSGDTLKLEILGFDLNI